MDQSDLRDRSSKERSIDSSTVNYGYLDEIDGHNFRIFAKKDGH
jgi:hypothetical protein